MTKTIAPLLLALAAGCSFQHVGAGREDANPGFWPEESLADDGAWNPREPGLVRVHLDGGPVAAEAVDALRRLTGTARTLVVLIHGCNNTYPEARRSYELARLLIARRDVAYLEVYWDGGAGDPVALWGHARERSKWAGLGLRSLLRRLDPDLDVRVLTHSRGASVIASALWNLPLREGDEAEERFRARQALEAPPGLGRYRLGLLVPAMGEEDFDGCPRGGLDLALVGVNEDDPAVGKGFLPASWFGSTRLGAERAPFYSHVVPAAGRASLIDFSGSLVHDFKDYLLRRAFREAVLPRLFEGYQDRSTPAVSKAP